MQNTNPQNPAANRPIGIFDSGIGGFTVMAEIMKALPHESLIYFGDTARVPYGSKSKETVTRYSEQISGFLMEKQVKAIVVACNTASACALDALVKKLPVPVIGVIEPGAKSAAAATENGRIGVIGTEATVKSGAYPEIIKSLNPEAKVFAKACPLFVPLVEEGWAEDVVTERVAERYLDKLLMKNIDTLILGCTHYPLLKRIIGDVCGRNVTLVNPAFETARKLGELLQEKGLLHEAGKDAAAKVSHEYYCSDDPERVARFAESFLGEGGISPCMVSL